MKPKLFSIIKHRQSELTKEQLGKDIVAGIIVAIIALPLSVALAIASGVTPEKGILTAIIAGFLISFLGGSRVQIGGPTGAFVVIVYGIVAEFGIAGLTVATFMAGCFMVFFGLMRFGSVIKYVPYPTTTGFTMGIAVVLFSTQIKDFLGLKMTEVPTEFIDQWGAYLSQITHFDGITLGVGFGSLLIMILWPKINKTIPGSLIALIIATLAVKFLHLPVETIGSRFGVIPQTISLIDFSALHLTSGMLKQLIRPALTIAFLASIESLLSAVVADGMIGKKHNSNMELVAQGVANMASALFGGIPATGAIARTAANVKNGGRTPIAGITHAVVLLLILIVFMPLANLIPMTTLSAILIMVAYNMSEWHAFKDLLSSTKSDITVLLVTFIFTILFDLVVAIEIGMVIAMFLFVRRMSEATKAANISNQFNPPMTADSEEEDFLVTDPTEVKGSSHIQVYEINGPLFFGAANMFIDILNEVHIHAKIIIFKMKNVPIMDATALNALKGIDRRCKEKHILLLYSEIGEQPMKLLRKAHFVSRAGEDRFFETTASAMVKANEIIAIQQLKITPKVI